MSTFLYKARDATGKLVKGTMEAAAKDDLIEKLHKMGYMTTYLKEAAPGLRLESLLDKLRPISADDLILFNIQLSNMINAGIGILSSLGTLGEQIENRRLREIISEISRAIEGGDSLSDALSRYKRVFPDIFISMVKAGEASGKLESILSRYAAFAEEQEDLRQKIMGALFYPVILLASGIAVTLFIVTFVIPQFAAIFMKAGADLPLPTLILFKTGTWIKHYWYFAVTGIAFLYAAASLYGRTDKGKLVFDRIRLKLPATGALHRKAAISRFARTLGTLLASGVPILESLEIAEKVAGNIVIGRTIKDAREAVEGGSKLAEPLKISEEFPQDSVQMIAVGEESGKLDGMLAKIADFYDTSIAYSIRKLTSIIEPVFLVVLGVLVAFIMASILLPIFDMIKILRA